MNRFKNHYMPSKDGIVCLQPRKLFNRPLYCTNLPSVVLAGDLPAWMLVHETLCLGKILPRIHFGSRIWSLKHPYRLVTTFKGNRVEYVWSSKGSCRLRLEVYPSMSGTGCWIAISSTADEPIRLHLKWLGICVSKLALAGLGGADPACNRDLLRGSFGQSEPRGYRLEGDENQVKAILDNPSYSIIYNETDKGTTGRPKLVNDPLTVLLKWTHGKVSPSKEKETVTELDIKLSSDNPRAWLWWGEEKSAPSNWDEGDAARQFQIKRSRAILCSTPSQVLNAAVPHASIALEGCYYPPLFVHGAMNWNQPYLGWSIFYGGIALGWAERLRKEFALAFAAQETKSATDPYQRNKEFTLAGPDSHFYGRGYIDFHQHQYNMQEVFFDQVIEAHAHRLLGGSWPKARKALEEHVQREKRCFDPADSSLLENCINTWASDSVWYNGGAGPIATAYHHRANIALGRFKEARRVQQAANTKLWLKRKGWYAEYQDAGSEPLLHEAACLYSIYLPITCGLADDFQSWQLLQYAKYELENVTFKDHPGRLCWLSQWVPYHWSVRELGHGETLMLSLAAFITGDAELAWDYLQGVIYDSQYRDIVPGGLQMIGQAGFRGTQGATDFGDPVSIYTWTLSRGLAGFRPVPNGPLRWEPTFPGKWLKADLQFPNHGVGFKRENGKDEWLFRQLADQEMELNLPMPGSRSIQVLVDGKAAPFEIQANVGAPRIHLSMRAKATHHIIVHAEGEKPWNVRSPSKPLLPSGSWNYSAPKGCRILEISDPQEVVKDLRPDAKLARGTLNGLPGHRLVFVKLGVGACQWWQPVETWIKPASPPYPCLVPRKVRGDTLQTFSLESYFNGHLKDLCAKQCTEPRPKTCGAQIGKDGYSPWTYPFWKAGAPEIDASVWHKNKSNLIFDGILFMRPAGPRDAVMVSRWSHLPREVVIPLNARMKRLYLLLAVNTSVMQAHMDVLKLTLMGDSRKWTFPLNYPRDVLSGIHEYDLQYDRSALPPRIPKRIKLGKGLQGCVLQLNLPHEERIQKLKWECLTLETIGGLLGVSFI